MADSAKPPEAGGSISETMFPDVKTTLNLFGIHKRQVRGNWQYPLHHHPQYEINYLLDGRQVMSVGGIEYAQGPGDLLLIRPGELHNSRSGDGRPFTYFCLHFDLDDRLFLPMLGRLEQVLFKEDSALARKVSPILRKMLEPELDPDSRSVSARMRLQSAVFELFALLWDAVSQEVSQLPPRTYGKEELAHEIAGRLQSISVLRFEPGQGRTRGRASGRSPRSSASASPIAAGCSARCTASPPAHTGPRSSCMNPGICCPTRSIRSRWSPACSAIATSPTSAASSSAGPASLLPNTGSSCMSDPCCNRRFQSGGLDGSLDGGLDTCSGCLRRRIRAFPFAI